MTGNKLFDNIFTGLLVFATLSTLIFFNYTQFVFEKTLPNDEQEFKLFQQNVKSVVKSPDYPLDKLVINLPSESSRSRFLEVKIHLIPLIEDDIDKLEEHKAIIQDSVIDIAGRMSAKELGSISGKILLESRIKQRINKFFGKTTVKKIYFTRFVIQ